MGKFRWIMVLCVVGILILGPIGLLFVPSWNTKLDPMLNLVDTLLSEEGVDKIGLGALDFVAGDEDSLTIRLNLTIDNTGGDAMLFPAINLTFKYGESILGVGWIPEAPIEANKAGQLVSIYAKMNKGDAFNQFLLSLLIGGLSLSISAGEAYIFLNTVGEVPAGVLSIPLPTIPLPEVELMGEAGWPPTIKEVFRGEVNGTANQPIEVRANVTDRGGGVAEVILSWTNGDPANETAWTTQSMSGLPMKAIWGGTQTVLGSAFTDILFPNYPANPIPTTWEMGVVNGTIPPQPNGTTIFYRVYAIDQFGYRTIAPTTLPLSETGTDTVDVTANTFSFTVPSAVLANYTARWVAEEVTDGEVEEPVEDVLASLPIDINSALDCSGSLSDLFEMLDKMELNATRLGEIIIPLVQYLEYRNISTFEVLDQLLGFSGGIPGLDDPYRINVNESLALDLLAEGGVGLVDLLDLLAVNLTCLVDKISHISPPLVEGVSKLLNQSFWDPGRNATLFAYFEAHDIYYKDLPVLVATQNKQNLTDVTEYTAEAASAEVDDVPLGGDSTTLIYFGSPDTTDLLGLPIPGPTFTVLHLKLSTGSSDAAIGRKVQWEYNNGSQWCPIENITDGTANFTKAGRVFFSPSQEMRKSTLTVNGDPITTIWVRLNITEPITGLGPLASTVHISHDAVAYYFDEVKVDMFGREEETPIPGKTDSIINMLRHGQMGYVAGILSDQGVNMTEFTFDVLGARYAVLPGPVSGGDIMAANTPIMMILVYSILGLAVLVAVRGRKGTYAISPLRVKKWYDKMVVAPSLKTREELEKYKMK